MRKARMRKDARMTRLPIRVVKVGGSLFDLPDLAERLHNWLGEQTPAHQVRWLSKFDTCTQFVQLVSQLLTGCALI